MMRVATLKKRKTNSLRRKPKHKTPKGIVHHIIFIIPLVNDKTRTSLSSSFSYLDISYRGPPGEYKARSIDFKVGGEGSSKKIFTIKKKRKFANHDIPDPTPNHLPPRATV